MTQGFRNLTETTQPGSHRAEAKAWLFPFGACRTGGRLTSAFGASSLDKTKQNLGLSPSISGREGLRGSGTVWGLPGPPHVNHQSFLLLQLRPWQCSGDCSRRRQHKGLAISFLMYPRACSQVGGHGSEVQRPEGKYEKAFFESFVELGTSTDTWGSHSVQFIK